MTFSALLSATLALAPGDCRMPANAFIVQNVRGYNSWPMIQAMGDRLVCTYSRDSALPADGHTINPGTRDAYAKVSMDGGRTWSEEVTVANDPTIGEVNEGIGLDSTGAAIAWVRCWGDKGLRRHELYRTTDGVSFERIASLRLDPFPMQIMDPVRVSGLGLVSPWFAGNYKKDGENAWGLLVSADDGRTWEQRTIESGLSVKEWVTEPSLVQFADGRLLIIGRCEQGLGTQFQVTSADGGKTWTKARTNIGDVQESTPSLVYDPKSGLVANYYYHRGARQLKRRVVNADFIFSRPTAWPEPEVLAEGHEPRIWDAGNVKATRLLGKTDCCAWYTGTPSNATVVVTAVPAPRAIHAAAGWTVPKAYTNAAGKVFRYRWADPSKVEPGKRYPLVVLFHGAGERGENNVSQLFWGAEPLLRRMRERGIEGYFLAGQVPNGQQWVDTPWSAAAHRMKAAPSEAMSLAIELLDKVRAELPVDAARIYATGISMGGYGTWDIVQRRPELFAAAMPVCGGGDSHLAWKIRNVPIWAWHGGSDSVVPVVRSRDMVSALWAVDGRIRYTEVPGRDHDVWVPAYDSRDALDWLLSQKRPTP